MEHIAAIGTNADKVTLLKRGKNLHIDRSQILYLGCTQRQYQATPTDACCWKVGISGGERAENTDDEASKRMIASIACSKLIASAGKVLKCFVYL